MGNCISRSIAFLALLTFLPLSSIAEDDVSRIDDWMLFKLNQGEDNSFCYITSIPYRTTLFQRDIADKSYFHINYKGLDQFTVTLEFGHVINSKVPVIIEIPSFGSFQLLPNSSNTSVASSSEQDVHIIDSIIESNEDYIRVISYDDQNNKSIDYYSLRGFLAALQTMEQECVID